MHNETNRPRAVQGAQSIERAVALLRQVTQFNAVGASTADLAVCTSIDRTTAHRILRCLEAEGLLRYSAESRRYFLGALAIEMGVAAARRLELSEICKSALRRVASETGDTVYLMQRDGYDTVCVDRDEGHYPIKALIVEVGTRRPLGIGAGSLSMLGAMSPQAAEDVLARNEHRIARFPGGSVQRLREQLAGVRANHGRVSTEVGGIKGVLSVSVALCDAEARPIGAISIAALSSRMSRGRPRHLLDILAREASALTTFLVAEGIKHA